MNTQNEDAAAIRAEISASRARVSHDLDEIGQRLNPHHIKDQVKENIREATIGRVEDMARGAGNKVSDVRYGVMNTVRDNPIPAALTAVGLAWLFMNRRSSSRSVQRYDWTQDHRLSSAYGETGYNRPTEDQSSSKIDQVKDRASQVGDSVKEKVSGLTDQAQDVASRVADTGSQQMRRAEDLFYENPLAVGIVAVAVGLAAGLAAPRTHAEVKLLGETRDQIVDKATEVARETTEKAQKVAQRAVEETKTAARDEGLVSEQPRP
jgi:ElaB/YqjD/DUF883 family membrane-anchored ribosome-binding protein